MSHAGPAVADEATRSPLTFAGVIRSEQIKLFSLRSTVWCYAILIVLTIGSSFILGTTYFSPTPLSPETQQATWVQVATLGISFSQLVIAVLGVLVITGEYGTGMIRSTFTAVPSRIVALTAKALVIGLMTFVISLISIVAAALLPAGLLPAVGIEPDFGDLGVWWALVGGAGYLALLAVLSVAIGAIIRNSAGGLATVLGLILVLPGVLITITGLTQSTFFQDVAAFLPAAAGGRMYAYVSESSGALADVIVLEPWQGLIVLLTWVAVLFGLAALLTRRRDV